MKSSSSDWRGNSLTMDEVSVYWMEIEKLWKLMMIVGVWCDVGLVGVSIGVQKTVANELFQVLN